MLLQSNGSESGPAEGGGATTAPPATPKLDGTRTHMLDWAPAPGWTVHSTNEGRLYYCNHVTRTAGWLPPAEAWKCGEEDLPFGWERAIDDAGRPYYINHVNKTTTYETPIVHVEDPLPAPLPRLITLERSQQLGFGFVAGSEKPVIVRFVTEGGPSVDKLMPGDQILSVNGEDVSLAPREHVISLVRACAETVTLKVCQPPERRGARKSTLLSASKRARLKCKPSRVRFAESVCVNGAPLFPPSAFSLGDLCVPPMANVLKVFLENGQTKSFKYDAWTTVQDVVNSLQNKLCIKATEHFSLIVEHIKSLKRNKLTLLDPNETLARIASRPGAHKLRCLFRVAFVPPSAGALAQRDLDALDYLYTQCCNDVVQERFAPELQYDTALRLAALHIYQHAISNNLSVCKLTVKQIEREFGLERFIPPSLLDTMKRKEVRKLVAHFLKVYSCMAGTGKQLTALQCKLHYLDLVAQLPSYGAKCFQAGPRKDHTERVILVSPKMGIGQIVGCRNSVPVPIANIENMRRIEVRTDDEVSRTVLIRLQNDKVVSIVLEERDASELVLVLKGYFHIATGQHLPVDQEESPPMEDLAPPFLSQHRVVPEKWSYLNQNSIKTMCFATSPPYQNMNRKTNGLYNTVGRQHKPQFGGLSLDSNMNSSYSNRNHQYKDYNSFDGNGYDLQSVVSMEILDDTEGKNEEVLRRVHEMQQLVENSEKYLTEQQHIERLNSLAEWQESSVDIDSDFDDAPGKLKHSDSLLLLTKGHSQHKSEPKPQTFTNSTVELLRSETTQSESDTDSVYTPNHSPRRKILEDSKANRFSFGLRSPDNPGSKEQDFQSYLQHLREMKKNDDNLISNEESETLSDLYVFDPDMIDLTLLPPPATPDELDCALSVPVNKPPSSFADSIEKLNKLGILNEDQDLEEFLASVTILPPTQKVTPAIELTPEEIMSYIIPPPPDIRDSLSSFPLTYQERNAESLPNTDHNFRRYSSSSTRSNIIEYSTVDRKGAFSCCKGDKQPPLPRRCSDDPPPERPPKFQPQERKRSHSLTANFGKRDSSPPQLPPRGENGPPPHLLVPPKKPPMPPVPPLDALRAKRPPPEVKTAGIGSPRLQRNRTTLEAMEGVNGEGEGACPKHGSAVSTPTSPHLGRGTHLTTIPNLSPESPTQNSARFSPTSSNSSHYRNTSRVPPVVYPKPPPSPRYHREGTELPPPRNGYCSSTREQLLSRADHAMSGLIARLDQTAAQCVAAQQHGGGRLIDEERFQAAKDELISTSLQLVTSTKDLVIAMSTQCHPSLPSRLALCLAALRRLGELCGTMAEHATAPLQTRNLVLKVRAVTAAFGRLVGGSGDAQDEEERLAGEAERLAQVLAALLRALRVFSP